MTLPMMGTITCVVIECTPLSVHGDTYFDLLVQTSVQHHAGGTVGTRLRVPLHLCSALPAGRPSAGQVLAVQLLLGQVAGLALAPTIGDER
ncbi:MAG: hypothetical protein ACK5TP_10355 [bacterium]